MGHIVKAPVIQSRVFEASKFEYKTRHLIDGRIVQCDQKISLVAGLYSIIFIMCIFQFEITKVPPFCVFPSLNTFFLSILGYMADEVCNLSAFTFMHRDDVRWVMVALRQSILFSLKFNSDAY